ncbi:MAG: prepilin-type N-terminal cleavage/methylation domain-containing protein [Desulfobacteraceae bacterium]|nr:prepilin-type N-terminal cleavage/methylation domain-containing protein [Desulfobacteraceae bacterium]
MTSACKPWNAGTVEGFTLLEIMVSLSIVAIVFVSLFKMQSSSILLAGYGKFHSTAPFLARQTLTQIEGDLDDDASPSGDFGDGFPGYQWEARITDYQTYDSAIIPESAAKRLKRVEIEILRGENRFTLNTWRYLGNE